MLTINCTPPTASSLDDEWMDISMDGWMNNSFSIFFLERQSSLIYIAHYRRN